MNVRPIVANFVHNSSPRTWFNKNTDLFFLKKGDGPEDTKKVRKSKTSEFYFNLGNYTDASLCPPPQVHFAELHS